jgi:two-component system sensor histidine kinase AlgZ
MHPIGARAGRALAYLVAWTLLGVLLGVLARLATGWSWMAAMAFGVPATVCLGALALPAWYVCRGAPIGRAHLARAATAATVASALTSAVWIGACRIWIAALRAMGLDLGAPPAAGAVAMLSGIGMLLYLLSVTAYYIGEAVAESVAERRRVLEAQVAQSEAEMRALRAQVDPHFLFNSLNSIAGLIAPDPAKARVMCQMLADFLRDSLSLGRAARIPLEREVALAEQYLRVERVRFGARLSVTTRVSAESAPVPVPPLILQPLVENAVRHGIATLLDGGTIDIEARLAGARAVVVVTNPRDDAASRRGTGFGMDIVRRRLAATFGDRASLTIEPSPDRFQVSLTIPVEEDA